MREAKRAKDGVKTGKEKPQRRWMPAGIVVGATVRMLFGNFVPGPAMWPQATGSVTGMSMGDDAGLGHGIDR